MCNFFNWIFRKKKQSFKEDETIMKKYLIVGLGNMEGIMDLKIYKKNWIQPSTTGLGLVLVMTLVKAVK